MITRKIELSKPLQSKIKKFMEEREALGYEIINEIYGLRQGEYCGFEHFGQNAYKFISASVIIEKNEAIGYYMYFEDEQGDEFEYREGYHGDILTEASIRIRLENIAKLIKSKNTTNTGA